MSCSRQRRRRCGSQQGDARSLPFEDGLFDAVTFTYLLRYVDDPAATLRELVRVVKPGGTVAGLEFGVPARHLAAALGAVGSRSGLPGAGRLIGNGWHEVGAFLGPSIREPLRAVAARAAARRPGATPASTTCARGD